MTYCHAFTWKYELLKRPPTRHPHITMCQGLDIQL
jgi:hypothetical protein